MKLLLPGAVFVLMVSIGMSLRVPELISNWRKLTWERWFRLLLATFLAPATVALLLARIFPLTLHETAGLFMVGATPGAPLLTRNLARRGFDMHLAASYQVWGAVLTPIMIPLMVFVAGQTLRPQHLDPAARACSCRSSKRNSCPYWSAWLSCISRPSFVEKRRAP